MIQQIKKKIINAQAHNKFSISVPVDTPESVMEFFYKRGYGVVFLNHKYKTIFWGGGSFKPDYERFNTVYQY